MSLPTNTDPAPLPKRSPISDDIAYVLPMLVFLLFTWAGGNWRAQHPWTYPAAYLARTLIVAGLLVWLWPRFTKIRWNAWWLGAVVGVLGILQWVGMQLWLQKMFPNWSWVQPPDDVFNPKTFFASPVAYWSFIALRMAGAVLVVPVMEELFWRDYLWRQILAPADFKLASVGEFGWGPFLGVAVAFAFVHGNWGLTAVVWALMIAGLLVHTRSLGACIIAHAVTNLLLALYVLRTGDWSFW